MIDFEMKFKNGEFMDMIIGDVGKVVGNIWNVSVKVGIWDILVGECD